MYTVFFCASAESEYLPPMVIYKAVASNVYQRWIKGGPPGTLYGSTLRCSVAPAFACIAAAAAAVACWCCALQT